MQCMIFSFSSLRVYLLLRISRLSQPPWSFALHAHASFTGCVPPIRWIPTQNIRSSTSSHALLITDNSARLRRPNTPPRAARHSLRPPPVARRHRQTSGPAERRSHSCVHVAKPASSLSPRSQIALGDAPLIREDSPEKRKTRSADSSRRSASFAEGPR